MVRWIVCQIGAREHYAVARALHRRGELAALVTDFWVPPQSFMAKLPGMQRLRERWHPDLADANVLSMNAAMLAFELRSKMARLPLWDGIMARNAFFQGRALRLLPRSSSPDTVLFSYSYAAADLFGKAKGCGWRTVLGQIDPGPEEERIVTEASRNHGVRCECAPAAYWQNWRRETELADRIVVNSAWSKDCLRKERVAEEKMVVVPLAFAAEGRGLRDQGNNGLKDQGTKGEEVRSEELRLTSGKVRKWKHGNVERQYPQKFTMERPMRVLFLGQVNVRKGVPELLEAARTLVDEPIEFLLVGGASDESLLDDAPRNTRAVGPVERGEAEQWYDLADVFVLPTHSDGFALTQLEAQAHGVPVIASERCGEVVQDGVNGVLLSEVSAGALVEVLRDLSKNPRRLESMARASRIGEEFSLERIGEALARTVTPNG